MVLLFSWSMLMPNTLDVLSELVAMVSRNIMYRCSKATNIARIVVSVLILPTSSAPKSEVDKDGLNEQADETQVVSVESKGIDVIDVLVDVAREDGDIEEGQ